MKSTPPLVLAFAASDPTGGAGLQADLLTIAAMVRRSACIPAPPVGSEAAKDSTAAGARDDMG